MCALDEGHVTCFLKRLWKHVLVLKLALIFAAPFQCRVPRSSTEQVFNEQERLFAC
jgi:hypothetical protein